jgi:outer membrane protein OmpA-like peptidoglycan-associated protein
MTDQTTTTSDSTPPLDVDLAAQFRMAPLPPPPPSSAPSSPASSVPPSPPNPAGAAPVIGSTDDPTAVSITDLALAAAAADLAVTAPVAPLPGTAPTPTVVAAPPVPAPAPSVAAVPTAAPAPAPAAVPAPAAASAPVAAPAAPAPPTDTDTDTVPSGPERSRRPLYIAVAAVVALAGIVGVLALVTGGGDDGSVAIVPEATLSPVTTAAPTTAPAATVPATTAAPTTTAAPATTTAPTTTAALVAVPSYPTLPDGTPEPIVAVFDGPTINVAGWVSSQEKLDLLKTLAVANSSDPTATVNASVQIDPAVPSSIGVRVIEMNSPRFNAGSSDITFEHGAQLDRVANVLTALPNVTATVVGHADQVGDEAANYALSEARAVSVVRYLVSKGVDPSRLSARAVGEQDLLAADASDASLALNRRTEFIFYGLLAD